MKYTWMDDYLMKKTGVTKDLKEEWNWIRYMVGGKLFVAICLDGANKDKPLYITLKLDPLDGDFLRQQYEDIIPGYYMNKVHWNSIDPDGEVPDDLLKDMLDKSYELVLHGFSKKRQQEILLTTYCGLDCTNCEYNKKLMKGFWWQETQHQMDGVIRTDRAGRQEDMLGIDYGNKSTFHWISVIRVPDFVSKKDFEWAVKMATNNKKLDCSSAEFITIEEGVCAQIMHVGPFDEEPKSIAIMDYYPYGKYYIDFMRSNLI